MALLHKLVELVLELCRAASAGVSILEPGGANGIFRWHAIAGAFAANLGGTMPREASPCGTVIARDSVLLFDCPERYYPALRGVKPRVYEALLAPWHVAGEAVGTLWAVSHSPRHEFDADDARLLASLARFASAAHQMVTALDAAETGRRELERRVEERTRALSDANENLRREAVERARAQEALRESEARFRHAIEEASIPVMMYAETGEMLTMSRAVTRITGYSRGGSKSHDAWLERAYGERANEVKEASGAITAETPLSETEFVIRAARGQERIWRFAAPRRIALPMGVATSLPSPWMSPSASRPRQPCAGPRRPPSAPTRPSRAFSPPPATTCASRCKRSTCSARSWRDGWPSPRRCRPSVSSAFRSR